MGSRMTFTDVTVGCTLAAPPYLPGWRSCLHRGLILPAVIAAGPGGPLTRLPAMTAPHQLILLRHGESAWNAENRFTGWVDADLSDKGLAEAERGGQLLAERNLLPDVVHTSVLRRAIATANTALHACARDWIPVQRSWRLNERHYGALQGKNKAETLAEFGEEQFMLWRRSYDVPPPPIDPDRRVGPDRRPAIHAAGRRAPRHRMPRRRARPGCCRTGTTPSRPTSPVGGPCWWLRTATRCAHW